MTMQAGVCVTNALIMVKDGVDEKDFEKFIKEEWSQLFRADGGAKGMTGQVAKADRGDRETGHYLISMYYDSFETREWYFPRPNGVGQGLSEQGQKEFDRAGFSNAHKRIFELAELEYRGSGTIIT